MRHTAAEKYEVIRLVEGADLPIRQTLRELRVNRSTFYTWYRRYATQGQTGLEPKSSAARRYWNRIPPRVRQRVVDAALARSGTVSARVGVAADGPGGPFSLGIECLSHPQGV